MQSNKASKKTPKMTQDATSSVDETSVSAELTSNLRTSKSSASKSEKSETGPAKHRRATTPAVSETKAAEVAPKTMAAAVGSSAGVNQLDAATSDAMLSSKPSPRTITHQDIALLAHSYWVQRGYTGGSPEEDWLRAEHELLTA